MGSASTLDRCTCFSDASWFGSGPNSLLELLSRTSSELSERHSKAEEHGLEQMALFLVDGRNDLMSIGEEGGRAHSELRDLFRAIVQNRLLSKAYRLLPTDSDCAPPSCILRVLQCTRLFLRDQRFVKELVTIDGSVSALGKKYEDYASLLFAESNGEPSAGGREKLCFEILSEIASIFKKLASDRTACPWHLLVDCDAHRTSIALISVQEPSLLASALMTLSSISSRSEESAAIIGQLGCVDRLLIILREYDSAFQHLASALLQSICKVKEIRRKTQNTGGVYITLGLLSRKTPAAALESFLCLFRCLLSERSAVAEALSNGAVPILLAMLMPISTSCMNATDPRICDPAVTCLICSVLSKLAAEDEGALQIRRCGGVYLLGRLLTDTHALRVRKRWENIFQSMFEIQTHAFRALRFVFSAECNRKMFKCIFPADLYESFIDVGNYQHDVEKYRHLAHDWCEMTSELVHNSLSALEDTNLNHGNHHSGSQRIINGYIVTEIIGAGAFGCVHRVFKTRSITSQYAMKELDPGVEKLIFGESPDEITASVGRVAMEVQIFSQLDHPNIVKYYESFKEGGRLYIIMELVEGVTLLDFIKSTSEKNERISEESIWDIFIQIVLALHYIHIVKGVVHRDLSPNNILIEHGTQRIKLADFGLAKAHDGDWSKRRRDEQVMRSAVGTIAYSSPEMIKHEPYGDKVDVWSLGCILYFMLALQPPFEGPNALVIASAVVEGRYASLEPLIRRRSRQMAPRIQSKGDVDCHRGDKIYSTTSAVAVCSKVGYYSAALVGLVGRLLIVEPCKRPSIVEVAAACAPCLMRSVENLQSLNDGLQIKLRCLQESGQLEGMVEHRKREAIRQLRGLTRGSSIYPTRPASPYIEQRVGPNNTGSSLRHIVADDSSKDPPNLVSELGSSRHHRCNFKIASDRVRPIADPFLQVITVLHKLVYIDQLPPDLKKDPRQAVLQQYKRFLFGAGQPAATIKAEAVKLLVGSHEAVLGQDASILHEVVGPQVDRSHELTYEELRSMLEEVSLSRDFYLGMK